VVLRKGIDVEGTLFPRGRLTVFHNRQVFTIIVADAIKSMTIIS